MSSSESSPKRENKVSFKPVSPFDLFYQLTYMSAMAAAGISRAKTFEIAAASKSAAATYFVAINTLVDEFRFDYPEACRRVGTKAKSENMRSFLLRLSDALRSGEPLADFLAREAQVQGQDYENKYERDLEALKQWSNAFSSIVISVALIVIIQIISSMLYAIDRNTMMGLIFTGVMISGLGAWIIWRSAPREVMSVPAAQGSPEQRRTLSLFRMLTPAGIAICSIMFVLKVETGWIFMALGAFLLPLGMASMIADRKVRSKDVEFSTFLRSAGGMATSSGTTLKQALTKVDLSSFPALQVDITRLSTRLQALVDPDVCWHRFGMESGSQLINEMIGIFYGAIKIGGDPERVGFLCSLFAAKTSQLRAKRRMTAGTFSALATVMQAVVSALMVFVLSIVLNFAELSRQLMPTGDAAAESQSMQLTMINFSDADLQFLSMLTVSMIVLLSAVGTSAIVFSDGGYKLKGAFYQALGLFIAGVSYLVVPSMVDGILTL